MSVIINPTAASGGTSIGGTVVGGTPGSVLFIGAGPVLAQDNANFFWDDTNHILKLEGSGQLQVYNVDDHAGNYERGVLDWSTTANVFTIGVPPSGAGGTGVLRDIRIYTAGIPALYRVPNATSDNWFEGGAGNFTVTGGGNFGTGSGTLVALTSGFNNTAVGNDAMHALTTGNNNFAFGSSALNSLTSGSFNVAIGPTNMQNSLTVHDNVAIGNGCLVSLGSGGSAEAINIAIGSTVLASLITGGENVAVGAFNSQNLSDGFGNTLLGSKVAKNQSGSGKNLSTLVGHSALANASSLSACTVLGSWIGPNASLSGIIGINDGLSGQFGPYNQAALNWNYTATNVWSFHRTTNPQGLHVYNTFDDAVPTVNYERLCLDWNLTSNVARIASQAGGTGTVRIIAIDGFQKAGAPAAGDLPSGTWGVINDTSGGNTWLVYNNSGTIRKVQLV